MRDSFDWLLYQVRFELCYEGVQGIFESLGQDGHYNGEQKNCAFELINGYGIRATAKILKIPRRTLQRWCRQYGISVKRCPDWVYDWAERHRKRREFWARRGYF